MKTFIAILLTLCIINLAAKAHGIAADNPFKTEKTGNVKSKLTKMMHFGKNYPKHHARKCKHAQHRKLSSINKTVRDFLNQQLAIVSSVSNVDPCLTAEHETAMIFSSPINSKRMNEQEWIFYRKLQRLKLA